MRKSLRVLCSLGLAMVLSLVALPHNSEAVMADTVSVTKEDVTVEITTDKDAYSSGEEIKVTVNVKNDSGEELTDVNIRVNWPEGMTDADKSQAVQVMNTLAAGQGQTCELTGVKESSLLPIIIIAVVAIVVIAAVVVLLLLKKKNGAKAVAAAGLVLAMLVTMIPMDMAEAGVRINATKKVTIDGVETELTASVTYSQFYTGRLSRVTVHDPSVVYDPQTEMYYIFGSHLAWAKSEDLVNWKAFKNNLNTDFRTLFAEPAQWSAKGSEHYDLSGMMWAPDVIYNEAMGKWCMYMSINGDNWYSSIVLLTADRIDGDWTYVGPVVYSGFTNKTEAQETDFYDVYKGTDFPERYDESGVRLYGMNAIDPCVFYDEDGVLWMAYGSWFGGIYMIELDPNTGMRLASHTYETVKDKSDEYQGIKITGGSCVSGEGAYIEYVDGYYYLYLSYGGLESTGGYNMRVYRSENVTGPYVDLSGDPAIPILTNDNINGNFGVKVMSNFVWDFTKAGQVAQGHNSVISNENGTFLVYHTRFSNQGEAHQVRVRQQFVNEDGWMVTAPFDYAGEALAVVEKEDIVGSYKAIEHKIKVNYKGKECCETDDITLKEDGTITGAMKGTWMFSEKLGAPYVTMVIDDVEYNGVFLKQRRDNGTELVMTFTVLGDNEVNIWGYKPSDK